MPKIFEYGEYVVFFWSNEEGEPVHVHIAVRRPTENATKLWLTSDGGCIVANNNGKIPRKDLADVTNIIMLNHALICQKWVEMFGPAALAFYR